jgi:hypothetical protein
MAVGYERIRGRATGSDAAGKKQRAAVCRAGETLFAAFATPAGSWLPT